jgi:hypothetical protein
LLNALIHTGHKEFQIQVCEQLTKKLAELAEGYMRLDPAKLQETNFFEVAFQHDLLMYIKKWGTVYSFIDGKVSGFYNIYKQLREGKAEFPEEEKKAKPQQAAPKRRAEKPKNLSQECSEILMLASTMPAEKWMTDREATKSLQQRIENAISFINTNSQTATNQEALVALINWSEKMDKLRDWISLASNGDQDAARNIAGLGAEHNEGEVVEKAQRRRDEEDKQHPRASAAQEFKEELAIVKSEIDDLKQTNDRISKENEDLIAQIQQMEQKKHPTLPLQSNLIVQNLLFCFA